MRMACCAKRRFEVRTPDLIRCFGMLQGLGMASLMQPGWDSSPGRLRPCFPWLGSRVIASPVGAPHHYFRNRYNRFHRKVVGVKQPITVWSFENNDLPSILRIEQESFDRDAWSQEVFLEYACAASDLFLVARVGGRIAGYSIACLARHGAEIASLAVRPRYRQEGVATVLLKTTIRRVRRSGAQAVWLMVRRQNDEAIRLYRKLGFVHTGTVPNYYDDDVSGWRMRISLGDKRHPSSPRRMASA
jgi:ribosomal-protein-alanine N-acetyltransferase